MLHKPEFIMTIGLPASGKSSFYDRWYNDYSRYSTDDELEEIAKERGTTYDVVFLDFYKEALNRANAKFDNDVSYGKDIVWDQTNLGIGKRESILRRKELSEYYKLGVCFLPPSCEEEFEILMNRINGRTGKHIPKSVVVDMMSRYQMPTITEGFDDVIFYDTFADPDDFFKVETNIDRIFSHFGWTKNVKELMHDVVS